MSVYCNIMLSGDGYQSTKYVKRPLVLLWQLVVKINFAKSILFSQFESGYCTMGGGLEWSCKNTANVLTLNLFCLQFSLKQIKSLCQLKQQPHVCVIKLNSLLFNFSLILIMFALQIWFPWQNAVDKKQQDLHWNQTET